MDMNDVIFDLGGVERITHTVAVDISDSELWVHLDKNVFGVNKPTFAEVKAHIPVYLAKAATMQFDQVRQQFTDAVQAHIDATAKIKGYDSGVSCASYATDPNPSFAQDAAAFIPWRSSVWLYCYQQLALVQAGTRPLPTVEEIINELPAIGWM